MDLIKRLYIIKLNKNVPIYHVMSKDLEDYTTTEKDMKKGENRYPPREFRVETEDLMKNLIRKQTVDESLERQSSKISDNFDMNLSNRSKI